MEWLLLIVGIVVGGVAAWFLGRAQARDALEILRGQLSQNETKFIELRERHETLIGERAGIKADLEAAKRELTAKETFIAENSKRLADEFAALSKQALSSNSEEFLRLAKTRLETLLKDAEGDLTRRQVAIDNLLKPLNKALEDYQRQTQQLETTLRKDYGSLEQHLKSVATSTETLSRETANLGQALRTPQVRGRWGELTLRNVAEIAGMSEHCDFVEQESVQTDEGKQRPDMMVHLPGGRRIVVDAKVPLVAFLDALEAPTENERRRHLERHAGHVKTHMRQLSAKSYWSQFAEAPDFVVMFIPGESFFSAAVDADPGLIEDGLRSNVILASPTTFVALLRAVEMGWRQEQLARNAAQISRLGAEIHDRIVKFAEHLARVGRSLEQATDAYNKSVGSLETRVLVSARKFKELGATSQDDIPELPQIDRVPRQLQGDLLTTGDDADAGM
ncbi:MAG TPA: DNA recombination protein RmuC [Acidobacteriota bacterium]|nr:DNA recombination protein RmuC [Acidobacteriota bacterium]